MFVVSFFAVTPEVFVQGRTTFTHAPSTGDNRHRIISRTQTCGNARLGDATSPRMPIALIVLVALLKMTMHHAC